MDFNVIQNKEELRRHVISELKSLGIKCFKEKYKTSQNKVCDSKRIFRTPLHLLELCDVILANGSVVQIPKFVADATNRILEQVETEGIFRKAGSTLRQKEIRVILENGMPLGRTHHVIDVANVIKYFFRELPEPLIPTFIQETMLRALIIGENNEKAIMLACLLLPTLTINTLRFFMQFLYTVSLSQSVNKMSTENLAIILTPGLMPFGDINSRRFINHLKVVQILIENANSIGIVPLHISNKLQINTNPEFEIASCTSSANSIVNLPNSKKKQKRRSGSLTHMFNGFKKMVGSTIGSTEELDRKVQKTTNADPEIHISDAIIIPSTPCSKSRKKRKFPEPMSAFSLKKKRDLLALLPNNSGGFLPNTPLTRKSTKHRTSLSHDQKNVDSNQQKLVSSIERRWSVVVGTGWQKPTNEEDRPKVPKNNTTTTIHNNTPTALKSMTIISRRCSQEHKPEKNEENMFDNNSSKHIDNSSKDSEQPKRNDLENIQIQYEQILMETESLSLQKGDILNREQKLLRRTCNVDSRSPSARKIGSIRRCRETAMLKKGEPFNTNNNERVSNRNSRVHLKRSRKSFGHIEHFPDTPKKNMEDRTHVSNVEMWVPGEHFFGKVSLDCNLANVEKKDHSREDDFANIFSFDSSTLSPKVIKQRTTKAASTSKVPFVSRIKMSGTINEDCGRASINRLRTDNAGMVIAKAKLFDTLGACNAETKYGINYNKTRLSTVPVVSISKTKNIKSVNMLGECNNSMSTVTKNHREKNRILQREF
ncbi:uncharacterized protein LOC133335169 [Musca vetustissima]|uniref:uncharacterized protein LOC133335169 n=1 Tax=Musca vetustissima TaxID=27455 RepID=UPI002AB7E67E|nr:uncharacterized protein LOC133335169 [Musca vetustissima]